LLFPFGNNNKDAKDAISVYLDFVDPKGAPTGWHLCVQFALVLWNPEDPTQFIYRRMYKD
jgi:ubiquitin carboxyl-terminal hydrolase 7